MKTALYLISNLVHQLQKERGCATLFLESHGNKFFDEIHNQFKITDDEIKIFKNESAKWNSDKIFNAGIIDRINTTIIGIDLLTEQRKHIVSLDTAPSKIFSCYTYDIIAHLLDIAIQIAFFDKKTNHHKITAYANFLNWKERAGRERAIGTRGFILRTFKNQEFVERMESLIQEQISYRRTFIALADEQQRIDFENIMASPSILRVDKMNEQIKKAGNSQMLDAMTAEGWYELMSHKIDIMQKVEFMLIDSLQENKEHEIPCHNISSISKSHYDFVCALPFFAGISNKTLSEILQHAQVKEYKKGKLLFLEGEHNTRFYIILSGWVKLFKGTASGEEAILQMLSGGDILSESAVFLNAQHAFSAQIAEDAMILTFPAPIIREYIRNNNEFAVNMLTNLSLRSQMLIHQVESTRLKSVQERVGWFLLKLVLNEDNFSGAIKLPYDKAMIASYLDMKPETFSRTLKLLKEDGFKIENNTIILPDIQSLCGYCDFDTQSQCHRHGTIECPNND